jgi:hypothetical protein
MSRTAKGLSEADYKTLRELEMDTHALTRRVKDLHKKTGYEDLEHAVFGLQIVGHALKEVQENKGKGGKIETVSDPEAHQRVKELLTTVDELQGEAKELLRTHQNEDLETAIKALEISRGSLEEVVEGYGA